VAADDVRQIREIVSAINQAWVVGDYDAIGQYVAEHVVMAPPGDDQRVLGRAAYVASFRHFADVAKTSEFTAGLARVDIIGATAVAVCPFTIAYEIEGENYRETGTDLLVFAATPSGWKVVWRTLTSEPQPAPETPQQA
jgi:ketosteroid isomerase-like protein